LHVVLLSIRRIRPPAPLSLYHISLEGFSSTPSITLQPQEPPLGPSEQQLNALLSSTSHASPNASFERVRPYCHGQGHRRRISQARTPRTSIYETIQEEFTSTLPPTSSSAPADSVQGSVSNTSVATKLVDLLQAYVVYPETSSVDSFSLWDDEQGITALRRCYALRDEAEDTVTESQRTWWIPRFLCLLFNVSRPLVILSLVLTTITPLAFEPPHHRSAMQAMLEHSLQNYGPLPSELRLRRARSRVNSRPSPYPRTVKTSFTSSPSTEHLRAAVTASLITSNDDDVPRHTSSLSNPLQQITINPNISSTMSADAKKCVVSPDKPDRVFGLPLRPRLGSVARCTTAGWTKKSTGRTNIENKENNASIRAPPSVNVSQGTIAT
jgi:serine/arginine repetitive matrix protein 2